MTIAEIAEKKHLIISITVDWLKPGSFDRSNYLQIIIIIISCNYIATKHHAALE